MASPLEEHDYIGLAGGSAMDGASKLSSSSSSSSSSLSSSSSSTISAEAHDLKGTELRLGLPGSESPSRVGLALGFPKSSVSGGKRGFSDSVDGSGNWGFPGSGRSEVGLGRGELGGGRVAGLGNSASQETKEQKEQVASGGAAPAAKAQVVGWPPIRNYRKNTMALSPQKNKEEAEGKQGQECLYVKVSMDGAPYLRKVDLRTYFNYKELSLALEKMFSCFLVGRDGPTENLMMDAIKDSKYVLTYEDKDGDWMLVGDVPWDMFTNSCRKLRISKGPDATGNAPRAAEKKSQI
ncbi:auxin-responsive protein IAA17-like [Ananas comosus]|uniref:Auxin-responsive protein n=1 Tax=Ananas comosus TaxID=4615 RepID=A0A6P5G1T4_ANACO|nr:auxin-responsive protein IAA17-like [Ananas comosus]